MAGEAAGWLASTHPTQVGCLPARLAVPVSPGRTGRDDSHHGRIPDLGAEPLPKHVRRYFKHRPGIRAGLRPWAVLGVWGLPFLLAPPIFSHDAYSYAAQGWLLENDISPYEGYPGLLPGAFADQVAQEWRYST